MYMFKVNNFSSKEIKWFDSTYDAPSCEMFSVSFHINSFLSKGLRTRSFQKKIIKFLALYFLKNL
jgi:hypothetical protein